TFWVGVPNCPPVIWAEAASQIPDSTFEFLPILLYKEQYKKYYNGFSNSVLWPLFHYFPSFAEYDPEFFEHYMLANEHFAEVMIRQLRPGDTVWIHDYHLLPLANMLRDAIPELTIGFFLHIPFPSFEIFRLLPRKWQAAILKGMLGADLIGFHTIDYAAHFLQTIQMVLGIDSDRHVIRHNNRLIKVDVFPISIDYDLFNNTYDKQEVCSLRQMLKEKLGPQKIIFSVDRLDYTKGVHNRLKAYELFLKTNPEYIGKVIFIMVIVPSRDNIQKYVERKRMIEELVSKINSQLGSIHWQPVNYRYNFLAFDEMVALYTACDLVLITPLRDGMNLVAKEFVASRKDKKGVLVISEMAGAARELTDALIINPNDVSEIADKINEGLEMRPGEQTYRLEQMQTRIKNYNVEVWAEDYLTELENIKKRQKTFQISFLDDLSKRNLLDEYREANNRLLLLDYDGTLVPFAADPQLAYPGKELIDLIGELSMVKGNDVFLVSGRDSEFLQKHFGSLPVNLIAEHGARSKSGTEGWVTEVQTHSEWKGQVHQIMEMYVRRCPHSFIEEKDFSIVWHYRNSNKDQGKLKALELRSELSDYIHNHHLQVLSGDKIIEVRNRGIDKGTAIKKVLSKKEYDFIFAVGDDRTDEDMFKLLLEKKNCFSIKVGTQASYAKYNLMNTQMVVSLLSLMNRLSIPELEQKMYS
ncbi:MAG TPA: bifunctional alpha,alpha-trehalose-phosphate synthase (UDP-forming)/trehalose-phosphatase, partial [Flavisolibacter sp.]|nr:bifunctional alpha,alpha-trehalose-phosphate synthase (UDP-forming)/trehalose-phosphatase [Flavisolibacter sp.]